MKTDRIPRLLIAAIVILAVFAFGNAAFAAPKANHHNGQQLLGAKGKGKANAMHEIHKKGNYTTSVEMKNGKVAGVHVKHATKGDVPVKKYKTSKKMASSGARIMNASFVLVQDQYLGSTYIGYSYLDEDGYEEIYWFPYDMILDGDTGAIEYVPAY